MAVDLENKYNYINKFQKENYDRITILRTKGDKDKLKAIASEKYMSTTEFINWCIDAQLKEIGVDISSYQ